MDVTGGWHDASDYLQYLPTSANTVYQLLFAYSMQPEIWGDAFDASGRPGANGVPDIVDEARWGLEWMCRMNPSDGVYYNQIADDRDHRFAGLPFNDNVDYGWGAGADRPVYPVCGEPYGLQKYTNRSTGEASSVAKFASAFALGAKVFGDIDSEFAAMLSQKATGAFDYALRHPGASQTAPCVSPYFYEEDNWVDDVELQLVRPLAAQYVKDFLEQFGTFGNVWTVTVPCTSWSAIVDSSPGSPRKWSPCRCDMNIWDILAKEQP